ncbi:hypothetical protein BURMUCF2_1137 [Burkholderia multivorans CF2]|nr:hypothetical protein BURMUCF2_1137 [Burkholderia multivorans CF2]
MSGRRRTGAPARFARSVSRWRAMQSDARTTDRFRPSIPRLEETIDGDSHDCFLSRTKVR